MHMYTGDGSWDERLNHFDNVEAVDKWAADKVTVAEGPPDRMSTKGIQAAAQGITDKLRGNSQGTTWTLQTREQVYLACGRIPKVLEEELEGWADSDLRVLVDQAFPTLSTDAW